jgi:hypothetical protein
VCAGLYYRPFVVHFVYDERYCESFWSLAGKPVCRRMLLSVVAGIVVECIQKMQEDLDALSNLNLMSVRPNF